MRIDELFEAEGKTAVAAFGRMNPPTIGHEKLVDAIKSQPGDHYLFLSQTQKPKDNPLPFDVKLKFAKRFFPGVNVGHPDVRTPMHMMKMLDSLGYTDVIYVAGSDRVDQFDKLLNDYNGKEYSFNSIKVISAGERDPDADGAEGMSASKMRAAAANDDFESFEQGVPKPDLAQDLYNAVRQGMGIKELEPAEAAEPPEGIRKRDLLNRSLRAQGHQVVADKKKKSKQGYQKHRGTDMKFNDVYSEAGSYYNNVDPYVAELGRRLMKAAESMKDETKSGMLSIVGSELTSFDGNLEKLLKKLSKYGVSGNDLTALMDLADKKLPPTSASDVPDPEPQDDEDDFKEAAKQHPRDKIAKRFEKVAGYSLEDREKEYQAILDKYKKEREESEKDVDEGMGDTILRKAKVKTTKGKPDPKDMPNWASTLGQTPQGAWHWLEKDGPVETEDSDEYFPLSGKTEFTGFVSEYEGKQDESIEEGSNYQDGIAVIQMLKAIVRDKQAKAVPFMDGKGKVDMFTASAVTKVFDSVNDENQRKMLNMIGTRAGFMKIADFAMKQVGRTESMGEDNHDPSDHGEYAEREMAETQLEFIKYACEEIDEHIQQFPMPEWFQNKLSGVHNTMMNLHAYIEGQEGKVGITDSVEEGKQKGVDGKACWDGYKRMGTKKKGGKTVDNCVPMTAAEKNK